MANEGLVSKVLVLDDVTEHVGSLKALCEACHLVGIKPLQGDWRSVMDILKSNVDLGGILVYENYGGKPGMGVELAREIHTLRPELPIFLRRDSIAETEGLNNGQTPIFRAAFTLSELREFKVALEASIFSRAYPTDLVRGISQMTLESLQTLFANCQVTAETPYLVKDRIIYGEVFSMISIDSHWCRGYMMLQADEQAVLALISQHVLTDQQALRELNNYLGEATNLIWGSFKNRYIAQDRPDDGETRATVPIIINHHRRYISFGSDDPQLCLKYMLKHNNKPDMPAVPFLQRFVFNLKWLPEAFMENPSVDSLVDSGELELF